MQEILGVDDMQVGGGGEEGEPVALPALILLDGNVGAEWGRSWFKTVVLNFPYREVTTQI